MLNLLPFFFLIRLPGSLDLVPELRLVEAVVLIQFAKWVLREEHVCRWTIVGVTALS